MGQVDAANEAMLANNIEAVDLLAELIVGEGRNTEWLSADLAAHQEEGLEMTTDAISVRTAESVRSHVSAEAVNRVRIFGELGEKIKAALVKLPKESYGQHA